MERFIDINKMGLAVVFAVQSILVLFFVISPISGAIIANKIRKRTTTVIILAILVIIFNVIFVGVTYFLQDQSIIVAQNALLIGLATATIATIIIGILAFIFYRDEPSPLEHEKNNITLADTHSDFSFQQRRQERLKKRARRR